MRVSQASSLRTSTQYVCAILFSHLRCTLNCVCHLQDDDVTIVTDAVTATAAAGDSCADTAAAGETGRHRKDDVVIRLTREALQLASAWCHVSTAHADVAESFPFVVHELLCYLNDPAVQAQLNK
jgi:hypothetical protein